MHEYGSFYLLKRMQVHENQIVVRLAMYVPTNAVRGFAMTMNQTKTLGMGTICLALALAPGCASKKYVRGTMAPVEARVGTLESKTEGNAGDIATLDDQHESDVSRLDERATDALEKANEAQTAADRAQGTAEDAAAQAAAARAYADSGLVRLEQTMVDMSRFEKAAGASVLFGFDKSVLNDDGKQRLATLVQQAGGHERYVMEVRGFTDSTGNPAYNLKLSQLRAESVVRELNGKHGVPLRAIHRIGLGEDAPMSDNKSRAGREQNRRVEVTLFVPKAGGPVALSRN